MLDLVRSGASRSLVVHGEAGVGKTALLDYLGDRATDCRVARSAGVQSEIELAFAGLHQLCAPMLDGLDRLPAPQRDALSTAFGVRSGPPPDRFLVGLAVLGLFTEVAAQEPLVCLVDDAQWLDRASAPVLAFVARRLGEESVALVFGVRGAADGPDWAGLPRVELQGLGYDDARALLDSAIRAPVDALVRDRIIAESRGNPLALLELPRGLTTPELASGFRPPDAPALSGWIEESFRRRFEALPVDTRRLLLVAAAEPGGEPVLLWRAAARQGIGPDAAGPATAAELVELGGRVRFRHPLVRSAIYRAASPEERRSAHRALADATDPDVDPDRRAWHRSQGTAGPDEDVAADLERSAARAQARGGLAAGAAYLERAAELTPDAARRAQRALDAAQAKQQAGLPDAALALLGLAEAGPLDGLQHARMDVLRGQLAFASSHSRDAPALLLRAAGRLVPLDAGQARETYLDALSAAVLVGRLSGDTGLLDVAAGARAAPPPAHAPRAPDLLLDGLALVITEGYAAGAPTLGRAVRAFRGEELSDTEAIRWLWLATHAAHDLLDDEGWDVLCARHVDVARRAGALAVLPIALTARVGLSLYAGDLAQAAVLVEEVEAITAATGSGLPRYAAMALAAWQGREAEASALIAATESELVERGEGMGLSIAATMAAVLGNGLGRYEEALAAAQRAAANPAELGFAILVLPELVEAATRCGRPELAADAVERLAEVARAGGTELALGLEARCRALMTVGDDADALYREAIDRLGRTRMGAELGRAHLLYGEWLRRSRRRAEAREHLRTAHEAFLEMGAGAFAGRAERELLATGATARRRTADAADGLTAQEVQIVRLARDGLSNAEIGARLFISHRTVEYHLHKVFAKLDISSRTELARVASS